MEYKTIAFIITTFLALSGWGTILYNWLTSTPKIDGRILNIMTAEWHIEPKFNSSKTVIMPYLYIVNRRKNPVHILDYELYFDTGNGYERALRVYGTQNLPEPTFHSQYFDVKIPDFSSKLIYSKNTSVEYGSPLHGFALFATDRPHNEIIGKINRIKIKCIDAFNNSHEIKYKKSQETNLYLLNDIAGIDIKQKKGNLIGVKPSKFD
jgi:hypothetical protein